MSGARWCGGANLANIPHNQGYLGLVSSTLYALHTLAAWTGSVSYTCSGSPGGHLDRDHRGAAAGWVTGVSTASP